MVNIPVITLDGPSGSGKSTLARWLSHRLGWHVLDSGALYRILGLLALDRGIPLTDVPQLLALMDAMDYSKNVHSKRIRTQACSDAASQIAVIPEVREALVLLQRSFRCLPGLIADGRDMGSVIFPDASLKFFIDASPEQRAQRRQSQLSSTLDVTTLAQDLAIRDQRDRQRTTAPLKPAHDAVVIDSTDHDLGQTKELILWHIRAGGVL